jgi:hypothetical protein
MKFVSVVVMLCICCIVGFGQVKDSSPLILSAVATDLPEVQDNSNVVIFVKYQVRHVCSGVYKGKTIRVAHVEHTAKSLKVGEIVCLKLERTNQFRKAKADLLSMGKALPDEYVADYIYAGFGQTCSCDGADPIP